MRRLVPCNGFRKLRRLKRKCIQEAYEKAKAQEAQQTTPAEEAPVVTPLVEKPATQTTVVDNSDNVGVKSEAVTVVDGGGLKLSALWSVRLAQRPTLSVFSSVLRIRAMLHRWLTTL